MKIIAAMLFAAGVTFQFAIAQPGLLERELFRIPTEKIIGEGPFTFKLAVDSRETIAINSCNKNVLYYIGSTGKIADSLQLPFDECIRNMEFDEYDNLLIMDNGEQNIYRHDRQQKKLEKFPYRKPEDWYTLQNHYYKYFEISSIPTFYNNKEYLQDAFYTRFDYAYNLWLNYADGFIYQSAYNFIRKIGNHRTYVALKKSDLWFSERLSNKCKLLFIIPDKEIAVYYNRALVLIYEDFKNNVIQEYSCPAKGGEAVQFDFATNLSQKKIWGISRYDQNEFTISTWILSRNGN